MSARAVVLGTAHLPVRKNVPVRADNNVQVRVQERALQVAEASAECLAHYRCARINVQIAKILAPLVAKGHAPLVARGYAPLARGHAARVAATTAFTHVIRFVITGACKDVQERAAIRVESAVPEQPLCFREPI